MFFEGSTGCSAEMLAVVLKWTAPVLGMQGPSA